VYLVYGSAYMLNVSSERGHAYVYLVYGSAYMLNVSSEISGDWGWGPHQGA